MKKYFRYVMAALMAVVSMGFVACSDDDDDDDDKGNGGSSVVIDQSSLVGTWIFNKDASMEEVTANGESLPGMEDSEADLMADMDELTFFADGKYLSKNLTTGENGAGVYSVNGEEFRMSTIVDGKEITAETGADLSSVASDFLEGAAVSMKVNKFTVELKGDRMFITLETESKMNLGDFGGDFGGFFPNAEISYVTKSVAAYDRKK